MSAHIGKVGVAYFSVPKCACTSLKLMFWHIENGRPFRPFTVNGKPQSIQQVYATQPFEKVAAARPKGAWTFAVLRDPAGRVVSCYRNRVVAKKVLERPLIRKKLTSANLPLAPSLSEFVTNLDRYRAISAVVDWHLKPLGFFLGRDPSYFDRLYTLDQMAELQAEMAQRFGTEIEIPQRQTAGPKLSKADLTPGEIAKIEDTYADDLKIFGTHF